MKMSDVFELPVSTDETFDDYSCMTVSGLVLLQDHAEHAAHAINNFDGLVEALESMLNVFCSDNSDQWDAICNARTALTAAKAEGREV
jgi:hypothetical protein